MRTLELPANFFAEHWFRAPALIEDSSFGRLGTEENVFSALLSLTNQFRRDADTPATTSTRARSRDAERRRRDPKLFIAQRQVLANSLDPFLPTDTDNNLRQYCARLEGMAAGQDVFLYVTGLQQYSFELWRKICGILSDLFKLTGFPLDYVDLELFLGKYEVTPGGIHRDRATTFHSVVFGQKSMLIWSQPELFPLEWSKEDCTIPAFQKLDYRQYLDIATVVEAGPGSTIYWAPDHWHCGSSKTFSVVLNVAINFGGRPLEFLFDGLSSSLNGPELERIALDECVGTGTLPSQLRAAAETLTRLPFESWVFESAEDHWLKRLTGCGFRQRPALRPPVVPINATVISRADSFPIFYYKRSSGYSVATAGHVWREVSDSFDVVKCVDMINSGATHELASYFAFCSPNPTSRLELTRFFQQLNAIGAVEFG